MLTASADEPQTQVQTILGTTTVGGYSYSSTADAHRHRSGITGQVFLITQTLNLGFGFSYEPVQVTLLIEVKRGPHIHLIKTIDTGQDGTFSVDLPPGTYIVEPDPSLGLSLFGTDTLEVTVVPRQFTDDEIDVAVSPFP